MKHGEFFVEFRDTPARLPADGPLWVQTASVADNFFDAFGASIISGRAFNTSDVELNRPIAIVDQAFVQQVLDGRNPIGQWVREPQNSENEKSGSWYEIVGVVADLSVAPAKTSEDAVIYLPAGPSAVSRSHVVVQLNTDARSFAPRLRTIAAEVDPTLRLYDVMGLDQVNEADQVASGFFLRAFAVVSAVALLLSTGGVYSMMAFTVARRTREIGIRTAIGADRWQILTGLFSRAFRQVGFARKRAWRPVGDGRGARGRQGFRRQRGCSGPGRHRSLHVDGHTSRLRRSGASRARRASNRRAQGGLAPLSPSSVTRAGQT
jgi:hypothetical protein